MEPVYVETTIKPPTGGFFVEKFTADSGKRAEREPRKGRDSADCAGGHFGQLTV